MTLRQSSRAIHDSGRRTGQSCARPTAAVRSRPRRYSCRALEVMERNFRKTINADGND